MPRSAADRIGNAQQPKQEITARSSVHSSFVDQRKNGTLVPSGAPAQPSTMGKPAAAAPLPAYRRPDRESCVAGSRDRPALGRCTQALSSTSTASRWLDLRPHRHRLHDGVRHHRHGNFASQTCVHGVGLHRADRLADSHHLDRIGSVAGAADRADRRHGADLAGQLGDRARRLLKRCAARTGSPCRSRRSGCRSSCRTSCSGRAPQQVDPADVQRGDRADVGARRLRRGGVVQADQLSGW